MANGNFENFFNSSPLVNLYIQAEQSVTEYALLKFDFYNRLYIKIT